MIAIADPKQGKAKSVHLFLIQGPRGFKFCIIGASLFLIKNPSQYLQGGAAECNVHFPWLL